MNKHVYGWTKLLPVLLLALGAGLPTAARTPGAAAAAPRPQGLLLTVDSTLDTPDPDPADGRCGAGPGSCTLRAAIQQANASPGLDGIIFAIPGSGTQTIAPQSELPTLTDRAIVDGSTQPGFHGTPLIVLDGSKAPATARGLAISGGSTTVRGLQIGGFGAAGVEITKNGGNVISGNVLGGNGLASCGFENVQHVPITAQQLGLPPRSTIVDMNDCDQLVGTYTRSLIETATHAFIWLPAPALGLPAGLTDIAVPGEVSSRPITLNDHGEVLGITTLPSGVQHPFLWLPQARYNLAAGAHDLTGVAGWDSTNTVYDIDNAGEIAGMYMFKPAGGSEPAEFHAFRWLEGTRADLGLLPAKYPYTLRGSSGTKLAQAVRINDAGQVAGLSSCGAAQTGDHDQIVCRHAAVWERSGPPRDLGALGVFTVEYAPGPDGIKPRASSDQSAPEGMNNRGQVVGLSAIDGTLPYPPPQHPPAQTHGVIWNDGAAFDLGLFNPLDIDDAGDIIGQYMDTFESAVRWHDGTETNTAALFGEEVSPKRINNQGDIFAVSRQNAPMFWTRQVAGSSGDGKSRASLVIRDAPDNTIGGLKAAERNVIVGGGGSGIRIEGAAATNNKVLGNHIGVAANGTSANANQDAGVTIVNAPGNTIGGAEPGARNVISANLGDGIRLEAGASGNRIVGNFIGLAADGEQKLGNRGDGVRIVDAASNVVGGPPAAAGNTIAYNQHNGVVVTGATAQGDTIRANSIYDNAKLGIDLGDDGVTLNDATDADAGPNGLLNFPTTAVAVFDGTTTHVSGTISTTAPLSTTVDLYASKDTAPGGFGPGRQYLGAATPDAKGNFTLDVSGRLPFPLLSATATDALGNTSEFSLVDTDGDSLPDRWEMHGATIGDTTIDLPAMGADPTHKDVFVHADWMDKPYLKPKSQALKIVSDTFARGPLGNPDGKTGIHLHVDAGPDSVMNPLSGATWGTRSRAGTVPYSTTIGSRDAHGAFVWDAVDTIKAIHFNPTQRAPIFDYMCFCSLIGGGGDRMGVARVDHGSGGHDFLVTLDGPPVPGGTPLEQAGTFMHELGHNLGLQHGGGDEMMFKPNYLSVMNYTFQQIGLVLHDSQQRVFDYSRRALPTLNEAALDESVGIQDPDRHDTLWGPRVDDCADPGYQRRLTYPALDWDCDAALSPGLVSADLNGDSLCVSAGPDGVVDTPATGDDIVSPVLLAIFDGPNRTCDSTAAGDDVQKRHVGAGQPGPLVGFADWPALRFDGNGSIGGAATAAAHPSRAARAATAAHLPPTTLVEDIPGRQEIRKGLPPEIVDAELHAPVDVVTLSTQGGDAPLQVTFDGSSSTDPDGKVVSWAWDFGDGAHATGTVAEHTYTTPGEYVARLIVTDDDGHENLVPLDYHIVVGGTPPAAQPVYLPLVTR